MAYRGDIDAGGAVFENEVSRRVGSVVLVAAQPERNGERGEDLPDFSPGMQIKYALVGTARRIRRRVMGADNVDSIGICSEISPQPSTPFRRNMPRTRPGFGRKEVPRDVAVYMTIRLGIPNKLFETPDAVGVVLMVAGQLKPTRRRMLVSDTKIRLERCAVPVVGEIPQGESVVDTSKILFNIGKSPRQPTGPVHTFRRPSDMEVRHHHDTTPRIGSLGNGGQTRQGSGRRADTELCDKFSAGNKNTIRGHGVSCALIPPEHCARIL